MVIRISSEEAKNYIHLKRSYPNYIEYAVAFTLTTREDGRDYIEYYGKNYNINKYRR